MDLDNPVVQLCTQGMSAEAEGRLDDAKALFERAWNEQKDDFDAMIAAHYVARHQDSEVDALHWHRTALEKAKEIGEDDPRLAQFLASLYASVGLSMLKLGKPDRQYFIVAQGHLGSLAEGPYRDFVAGAIAKGLEKTAKKES